MPATTLLFYAKEALFLAAAVSLPVIAIAGVVGLVVASFQAATQVQDATLAHLPRFLAVAVALTVAGPWMARQIAAFAEQVLLLAGR